MNIILMGFQDSGKSTYGALLANTLQKPFFDTDHLLLEKHKVSSIASLHESLGEKAFREEEYKTILALKTAIPCVIALGGGSLTLEKTQLLISQMGKLIYLYLPYHVLIEKLQKRIEQRGCPTYLDTQDPVGSFKKLHESRHEVFSHLAFHTIEVIGLSKEEVVKKIEVVTEFAKSW